MRADCCESNRSRTTERAHHSRAAANCLRQAQRDQAAKRWRERAAKRRQAVQRAAEKQRPLAPKPIRQRAIERLAGGEASEEQR
jgi:hypothetical protein